MEEYNAALKRLSASIKARDTYFKEVKTAPDNLTSYDTMIALAANDFIKTYKTVKGNNPND